MQCLGAAGRAGVLSRGGVTGSAMPKTWGQAVTCQTLSLGGNTPANLDQPKVPPRAIPGLHRA